ncbi:MAG: peptidoglycan editing factor PgeF [Gammaproteobacteria bacterium]
MTGLDCIEPDWPVPDNVHAINTTRRGGFSRGPWARFNLASHVDDDAEHVARNRLLLQQKLGLPAAPAWLEQVHGTRIVDAAELAAPVAADGSFTADNNVVCAVLTADCLPVLLCDERGENIAAVHAGWRGLQAGILQAAVARFTDAGCRPEECLAWLGPAISAQAYEVGVDVHTAFLDCGSQFADCFTATRPGHWQMNIYAAARAILSAAGIDRIYGGDFCTSGDPRFYSYRRDGRCGRQASLIWKASPGTL